MVNIGPSNLQLLAQLYGLLIDLDIDPYPEIAVGAGTAGPPAEAAADLVSTARNAVSGFAGFQLIVVRTGQPVTFTVLHPDLGWPASQNSDEQLPSPVVTSVRVPLLLLAPGYEAGGRVVLYSRTPGALVDFAADIDYVFGGTERSQTRSGAAKGLSIELDVDLPPDPAVSGLTGLTELVTINRAAGVMIDKGHHPDTVHTTLRKRAAAAGLTVSTFAAQLLHG